MGGALCAHALQPWLPGGCLAKHVCKMKDGRKPVLKLGLQFLETVLLN